MLRGYPRRFAGSGRLVPDPVAHAQGDAARTTPLDPAKVVPMRQEPMMPSTPSVRTCLWFAAGGYAAASHYVSLIPNSAVETPAPDPGAAEPMVVHFHLNGAPYSILNGGPHYRLSPAASIVVTTPDQAETDRLWAALTEGGAPSRCGWLVDRYGLSWQIVPEVLPRLLGAADRAAAGRAMQAMLQMGKLEVAVLEEAFHGEGAPVG